MSKNVLYRNPLIFRAMRQLAQHRCNSIEEEESGKRRGFKIKRKMI